MTTNGLGSATLFWLKFFFACSFFLRLFFISNGGDEALSPLPYGIARLCGLRLRSRRSREGGSMGQYKGYDSRLLQPF